jgi:hypothetical protein
MAPPHTTDFAVMYLPTEGLFAEVLRRPGLVEACRTTARRCYRAGQSGRHAQQPADGLQDAGDREALLRSLGVLGQVKTEFAKFGEVVEATRKSIDAAARKFDQVGVRTRAIQRHLRNVQELPRILRQEPPTVSAAHGPHQDLLHQRWCDQTAQGGRRLAALLRLILAQVCIHATMTGMRMATPFARLAEAIARLRSACCWRCSR